MPPKSIHLKKSTKPKRATVATPCLGKAVPKALTASALRRVAKRGGVKRLAHLTYDEVRRNFSFPYETILIS